MVERKIEGVRLSFPRDRLSCEWLQREGPNRKEKRMALSEFAVHKVKRSTKEQQHPPAVRSRRIVGRKEFPFYRETKKTYRKDLARGNVQVNREKKKKRETRKKRPNCSSQL